MAEFFLWIVAVVPVFSVFAVSFFAHLSGVSFRVFLPNLAGCLLGFGAVATLAFCTTKARNLLRDVRAAAFVSLTLMAGTLLSSGDDGVHRWLSAGGFHWNVSETVLPVVVFAAVELDWLSIALVICALTLSVVQPDAAQATALSAAVMTAALMKRSWSPLIRTLFSAVVIATECLAWIRPDPLTPVDSVERILHVVASRGSSAVTAAAISTLVLLIPGAWVVLRSQEERARKFGLIWCVYWISAFVATEFGNFPVPVLGAGISSVLGWYVSIILLWCFAWEVNPKPRCESTDSPEVRRSTS